MWVLMPMNAVVDNKTETNIILIKEKAQDPISCIRIGIYSRNFGTTPPPFNMY